MAKIERKYLAHYINAGEGSELIYERLGEDLEEYSPSLSASVETKRNIVGESRIVISGYEKTAAVEPYYADKDSALFLKLQTILDEGKVWDDLKTTVVEVRLWENQGDSNYVAYEEEVYIEITSYGGDATGYQIPFTLHYTGKKVKGIFCTESRTFCPD